MTSSNENPNVTIPLPSTPEELLDVMRGAYKRGLDVADQTTPAERFESGYVSGTQDCIERLVECYGLSNMAAKHSRPDTEDGQRDFAFHTAQASAYHTVALTMMLNELDADPEQSILQFERLLYAVSLRRFGPEDEQSMLFPYEPTGLCDGSPERTEHEAGLAALEGIDGGDILTVRRDTDIFGHLQASYDRVQAANAQGESAAAPFRLVTDMGPAMPIGPDPSSD